MIKKEHILAKRDRSMINQDVSAEQSVVEAVKILKSDGKRPLSHNVPIVAARLLMEKMHGDCSKHDVAGRVIEAIFMLCDRGSLYIMGSNPWKIIERAPEWLVESAIILGYQGPELHTTDIILALDEYYTDIENGIKHVSPPSLAKSENQIHARLWTNYPEEDFHKNGKEIYEDKYNDLIPEKDKFEIFVVDDGKYNSREVGAVYMNGELVTNESIILENGKELKLSSAGYRFLIHLLKGKGDGGTSLDVAKAVWFNKKNYIEKMEKELEEDIEKRRNRRNPFSDESLRRIKKEKTDLQHILKHYLEIELGMDASFDVSHHKMKEVPNFCFIEIIS